MPPENSDPEPDHDHSHADGESCEACDHDHAPAKTSGPDQENPLLNIMINVLIPVVALMALSKEEGKFWHIGPLWGMIVAISFPLVYGTWDLIKKRKLNPFSVLGVVSVLLTGGITLYVWNADGTVKPNAAVLFAIKEAAVPFILGIAILASHWTANPLMRVFLYNPDIFDVRRVERAIKQKSEQPAYEKILFQTTVIMSASFFISCLLNYFLALHYLGDIDNTRSAYNEAIGKLTGVGFLVIGVPCLVLWMIALFRLIKRVKALTGLDTEEILQAR